MKENKTNDQELNSIVDVLVVDDQAMDQKNLSDYLKEYDVRFAIASNTNEAIKILADYPCRLILIAANLLEDDSFNIVQKIRAGSPSDVSIVAIIEKDLEELKAKCFNAGLDGCFTKPISRIELVGVLTHFLPDEVLSTKNIQVKHEVEGYKAIDLGYLKEISMGDIAYEKEITEKFIEIVSEEINDLNNCLVAGDYEKLKRIAHKMLSTIYVMGLGPKLSAHLQAIEDDDLTSDQYRYRVELIAMICEKAKEEAQVFLEQ
ncbi:hypothetical protein CA265_13930 [Sphingobacteriaceae bacterium GW460-11-11-14-LB5]|nr:hypothetical protein CA265_13930 [Sphingobacteriaceae bacterium GW460-11-11-14-LB5]